MSAIDLLELQYQRGECLALQQKLEQIIADLEHAARLDESRRGQIQAEIAYIRGEITNLERLIRQFDTLMPLFMRFDEAIALFKQFWEAGSMRGIMGYINMFSTDSLPQAQLVIKAARSTGSKFSKLSWKDGYYALEIKFKPEVLALIEGWDEE